MASLPIHWIEVRAYVHATEDEDRVSKAIDAVCVGPDLAREVLEGHFGNPIVRLSRRLETVDEIRAAWERWRSAGTLSEISKELEGRIDEDGILHLRLDKQAAYGGRLALAREGDPIDVRIKLKVYRVKEDEILRVARGLLEVA